MCVGPGQVGEGLQEVGQLPAQPALVEVSELDHNQRLSVLLQLEHLLFQFFFLGQVHFKETNGIKCKFSQDFQCLSILVKGDSEIIRNTETKGIFSI